MNTRSSTAKNARPTYAEVVNPAIPTSYQEEVLSQSLIDESPGDVLELPSDVFDGAPVLGSGSQVVSPDTSLEVPMAANSVAFLESDNGTDLANHIALEEPRVSDQVPPESTVELQVEESPDLSSAVAEALSCEQSPGMRYAAGSSIHSAGYCHKKKIVIRNFIEGLRRAAPKYNGFL